jgi:hypothetical protein
MVKARAAQGRRVKRGRGAIQESSISWLADLTLCSCGHERLWHQTGRNFCCYAIVAPPVPSRESAELERPFWHERHEPITGDGRHGPGGYDFGKGVAPRLCELVPLQRACPCEKFEQRAPSGAEPVGAHAGGSEQGHGGEGQ